MAGIKRTVWFTAYLVVSVLVILSAMEFAVRLLFPQINLQGNQMTLFKERRFNESYGFIPNSSGIIFGKEIHTDEQGFRQMHSPARYDKSWLFLGDSVTFGVGVDTEQTFVQLIQDEFQDAKIWNSSVVGYAASNYLDVADVFLRDHKDIDKVVLFFCLNDVYGPNLGIKFGDASIKDKILSLRFDSKLYLLLKKLVADRSKAYALYDIGLYKPENQDVANALGAIGKLKSRLAELNIDFLVVVLPYEYQLQVKGLRAPQEMLHDFFSKSNIKSLDLYEDFAPRNSEDYFLYGDPMHLSPLGHEVVARKLIEVLRKGMASLY